MCLSLLMIILLRRTWGTTLKTRSIRSLMWRRRNIMLCWSNTWTPLCPAVKLLIIPLVPLVRVTDLWLNGLIRTVDPIKLLSMLMRLVVKKVRYRGIILTRLNRIALRMFRRAILIPVRLLKTRFLARRTLISRTNRLLSPNLVPALKIARREYLTWGSLLMTLRCKMSLVSPKHSSTKWPTCWKYRKYGHEITR